jgi:hypothetical protein
MRFLKFSYPRIFLFFPVPYRKLRSQLRRQIRNRDPGRVIIPPLSDRPGNLRPFFGRLKSLRKNFRFLNRHGSSGLGLLHRRRRAFTGKKQKCNCKNNKEMRLFQNFSFGNGSIPPRHVFSLHHGTLSISSSITLLISQRQSSLRVESAGSFQKGLTSSLVHGPRGSRSGSVSGRKSGSWGIKKSSRGTETPGASDKPGPPLLPAFDAGTTIIRRTSRRITPPRQKQNNAGFRFKPSPAFARLPAALSLRTPKFIRVFYYNKDNHFITGRKAYAERCFFVIIIKCRLKLIPGVTARARYASPPGIAGCRISSQKL